MSPKRRLGQDPNIRVPRPKKRVRLQQEYHSSSDESEPSTQDFMPFSLDDYEKDDPNTSSSREKLEDSDKSTNDNEDSDDSDNETSSEEGQAVYSENNSTFKSKRKLPSKRNDPEAFSTSMSKILSTKLSRNATKDPLLVRSKEAIERSSSKANERLERHVNAKMRAERKEELERGRVKDVLGLNTGVAGEVAEEEKKLRKIAQRGVVKLFNAVRAAQVRGEEAAREERRKGTVGIANREAKINEMSKQGFLDLINGKNKMIP